MRLKENPDFGLLFDANSIENQEARGQKKLVESELLPTEVRNKEDFEQMGFEFGEPLPEDPIFCKAKLPAGFAKRPTNHSMWSEIVDPEGNVIANVFYKAAFYDRHAWMSFKKD